MAADVNVESSVDRLSKMKMRLVMLNRPSPKKRDTSDGSPPSMPVKSAGGTLRGAAWVGSLTPQPFTSRTESV